MEEYDHSDAVVETYEQHLDHATTRMQAGLGHFSTEAIQTIYICANQQEGKVVSVLLTIFHHLSRFVGFTKGERST